MAGLRVPNAGAKAHVFVADPEHPELSPEDRHHLERVLRLRPGEPVTLADGAGRWRRYRFGAGPGADGRGGGEWEPDGDVEVEPRPSPPIAVGFALTKGERPEWVVQKLTELGVDRIVPFTAERSIVRWTPERAAAQVQRWRRIVREAASQSRRAWLPEVEDVVPFATVANEVTRSAALAVPGGGPPSLDHGVVLVGPEGGWSDGELGVELPHVGLGPHMLRAETAAVAAGAVLGALRAGLVHPQS